MFKEIKSIPNVEINEHAVVRNMKTKVPIKPYIGTDGYQHIMIGRNGRRYRKRVHRLMAEVFLGNCKYVDHIDGNRANNELSNLRPCTNSENVRWGVEEARKRFEDGKLNHPIIADGKEYKSIRAAGRALGIDHNRICLHLKGTKLIKNHTFEYKL